MEQQEPVSQTQADHNTEVIIGNMLRWGVLLAAAIVLLGGMLYLIRYGKSVPNYRVFRGEPQDLRSIPAIYRDALSLRRRGMIQLGLLVLIATPIARVIFSIYAFARERDFLYVGITVLVLAVLLYSLVWGHI